MSDLDADVVALAFIPRTSCLLASDSDGEITLWVAEQSTGGVSSVDGIEGTIVARKKRCSLRDSVRGDGGQQESAPAWDIGVEAGTVGTGMDGDGRVGDPTEGGEDNDHSGASRNVGLGHERSFTLENPVQQRARTKEVRSHGSAEPDRPDCL